MKQSLTILLALAVTLAFSQEKTINKTFSGIKSIRLNTSSGDIDIKKSSGSDVKVLVKYNYDEDDFKPVLEQNSSKLTLKEEFSGGSHSGSSSWTLEVPDKTSVNINTGSGDITVGDVNLDVKTNSGSGNIDITNVSGVLDFNTGSGDFEITQTSGELNVNTGSGAIRVSKGTGDISLNAGSGNISLTDIKADIKANVGSGDIRSKNIVLTGSSSFNSGSGDVAVTLAAPLDFNISLNSGSGNSTLNFGGNAIAGEVVMTANKRNGTIVAPFKFDKEETIDDDNNSNVRIQKTAKIGAKDIQIKIGTGSGTAEITK